MLSSYLQESVQNIINDVLYLNEAQFVDHDIRYIVKTPVRRIMGHYAGKAPKNLKWPVSLISGDRKKELHTCADINVKYIPNGYDEAPCIKVCKRQSKKGNVHAFRLELNDDFTDIANNNNPKFDVNYIAFLVDNTENDGELHIYVMPKQTILKVVKDLIQNGAIYKKVVKDRKSQQLTEKYRINNKVFDEWGNYINAVQGGIGIVLSNKFIRDRQLLTDKFALGKDETSQFKNMN